jgi:hypothetical protein
MSVAASTILDYGRIVLNLINIFTAIMPSLFKIKKPSYPIGQLGFYVKTVCISPTFPQDGFCLSLELSE